MGPEKSKPKAMQPPKSKWRSTKLNSNSPAVLRFKVSGQGFGVEVHSLPTV